MPTSPTPAGRPAEELAATIETVLRESLSVWWQTPPRLDWAALAVARQLLGTSEGEDDDESCGRFIPDTPRAPGLCASCGDAKGWHSLLATAEETHVVTDDSDDPEHADDCPGCEPAPPAPADRAAFEALAAEWEKRGEYGDSSITDRARELRAVLAADAAAGVQPPTTGEAELTATLVINRSDSYCDGCQKPTLPQRTHHTDISGWTPKPGGGCGARFTATRSDYRSITPAELKDVRPDLPLATTPAAPAAPEETP
ncbi:hypothetical protein ACFWHG_05710 [Streptomyces microflavus]|uniref:hypothetical protein n=1 Tax=Streptomyces microflavus TaxID=1919 RepID=UPI00366760A1